jgi:exodeoxyribonuclease V alpha subunit
MSRPLLDGTNAPSNVVRIRSGVTIDLSHTEHKGALTKILHANEKGFFIGVVGGVSCVGHIHQPKKGFSYLLEEGEFKYNEKFSQYQFNFKKYTELSNQGTGLETYIVRECPGLGPVAARQIIKAYKDDALLMLSKYPTTVSGEIKGISPEAMIVASDWATGELSNAKIKTRLYEIGIMPSQVQKLIAKYGNNAEKKIRDDCFSLTEIHGFGFTTVDKIADLIGIPKNDPGRIKACLMYAMQKLCDNGHTCVSVRELVKTTCDMLGIYQQVVIPFLQDLIDSKKVISSKTTLKSLSEELGIFQ